MIRRRYRVAAAALVAACLAWVSPILTTLTTPSTPTWLAIPSAHAQGDATPAATTSDDLYGRTVARIQFRGNRKVEDDAIRVNLRARPGAILTPETVRADLRAVWGMGFFQDVVVEAEPEGDDKVVLIFAVAEKPAVRKVLLSGNDEVTRDAINEVLDLKRDIILDVGKVKENRDKIRALYVEKGFYLASVEYELRPAEGGEVDVWFVIQERSKVQIRDVSFIGNEKVTDDELRSIITTSAGGALSFISDSGIFQQETFERDLFMIQAYYYDRGFINVKLGSPQIRLSRDKRYMYLSIPIDEGPVFHIGDIEFEGDLIGEKADYYERLTVERGEVFNRSKVGSDINALTNFYKDKGYAYVNVTPLTKLDLEGRIVALTFEIERGNKVYFERINVRGNSKTRDKVIRREMKVSEGELYSQTSLDASRRRIEALGFFETPVNISTKRGSSDEFIEVNVEVIERPTGTFQIGAGFSSVESFIAQAQISQNNLFGRGQTLTLQAQLSGLRQLFLLRFVEPYLLDTNWTFAFDLFNQSRDFGTGFRRNSTGGNLTWGYPLSWESRVFLTYKLEKVGVDESGTISFGQNRAPVEAESIANLFRDGWTSSLKASVSYDSRNNRLFPTEGWNLNGFFEVADGKFGSSVITDEPNKFFRYGGFARHYRPIWGPFILKLNTEIGVTVNPDEEGVPITERYLIGGIYDVRGYRPRSLGPRVFVQGVGDPSGSDLRSFTLGGNLQIIGNAEIEFPLFERVGISGVVFMDVGNAFNLESRYCASASGSAGSLSPKFDPCFLEQFPGSLIHGLRRSVGFGFRWFSPIGPLRFEWGIPLDRQVLPDNEGEEESLVFEFTIGNFF
ncbi:outer membrane protein assembly factor BamA [Haliangium ochraceum]|uniref:Outer membrane protein assembly factor BamA n=1 Tax=Haliangium ochraceum (strain DSM 14365 / JCM 11303 / SMP-2) TaxID=502025 RepID=D0LI92_HALO1|nr:outer membrane protein assembly factor BamA [Haliangium ochraceum]ACY16471.1 outer membrane protein assembly complex, YaeT protein [Haliangium ochraceum DSM 14365]